MKLDAVVKVGGSLVEGAALDHVCRALAALAGRYRLLVIAGGGPLADAVRELDRRYGLRDDTAHWMAILAMDQLGYFLADRIPGAVPVRTEAAIGVALATGSLPILLPFGLLHAVDPLPHSWDVTSDSIAAWMAGYFGCGLVVLLKSVDGPGQPGTLAEVRRSDLGQTDEVDGYLATALAPGATCWLVNGTRPERLAELLRCGSTIGTRIV